MRVPKKMMMQLGIGISYLLRDNFITDLAAGAVDGTPAEPGPGTRSVIDTTGEVSIVSGQLNIKGGGGWGTGGLWYTDVIARASGKCFMIYIKNQDSSHATSVEFGLDTNTASRLTAGEFWSFSGNSLRISGSERDGAGVSYSTAYELAIVMHSAANKGAKFFIRGGTEYPDWCLVWVSNADSTASLYIGMEVFQTNIIQIDDVRLALLSVPFDTDYALTEYLDASSSNGDTFTHSADAFIEHTITAATGVTQALMFRRTDDDNTWIIRMDQTNAKIFLYEKQGGVETERGAAGGIAQTWTNGTAYRVAVHCHGTKILVSVGTTLKITYATATYNETVTGGKVSHAGANLISWPVSNVAAIAQLRRMNGSLESHGETALTYSSSIES